MMIYQLQVAGVFTLAVNTSLLLADCRILFVKEYFNVVGSLLLPPLIYHHLVFLQSSTRGKKSTCHWDCPSVQSQNNKQGSTQVGVLEKNDPILKNSKIEITVRLAVDVTARGGKNTSCWMGRGDFPNRVKTEGVSCNLITNTDEHTRKIPTYTTRSIHMDTHTHTQAGTHTPTASRE